MRADFLTFVADVLGVEPSVLTPETSYGSIPAWDSIAQLRLVTELSSRYGVEIPFADITRVTSLWEFHRRLTNGPVKKVVAVDLDDTLWQGVVGEDGVGAIVPNTRFQRELKDLAARGVLLVALSKNNAADVDWFFGDEPAEGHILCGRDFVARRIDWSPKPENLAALAKELNLGVDSFVFVDDNPVERLEMASRLPEVAVAEFPPRLAAYFPERELTEEDRHRTEEYRAEAARRAFAVGRSTDDFLRELGIRTDVHVIRDEEVPRVAQLSQKANQFNVCTNRYTEDDLRRLSADSSALVVVVRARDRFGDQGLVGYVIVIGSEVTDFVMSCRAMNRRIEFELEAKAETLLRERGVKVLTAQWKRSEKNAPVTDLFERFGFETVDRTADLHRYRKSL